MKLTILSVRRSTGGDMWDYAERVETGFDGIEGYLDAIKAEGGSYRLADDIAGRIASETGGIGYAITADGDNCSHYEILWEEEDEVASVGGV